MLINGGCRFVCGVFVIGLVVGFLLCFFGNEVSVSVGGGQFFIGVWE